MNKMISAAKWTLQNYKGGGASIVHAKRVLLLSKVSRLRKAGANLYRRGALAALEGRTKDFERLERGAAICMDKAVEVYKQAENI